MSMMLLTIGTSTPIVPVPSLPVALDSTVSEIRPSTRRLSVFTVSPLPGAADFTTIENAQLAGLALQNAKRISEGRTQITPNDRIDIIIKEGSYTETVSLYDWIHLYGEGSSKVVVYQLNTNAKRGTFEGTHCGYIEGMRIVKTIDAPPVVVYPVHTATSHTSIWVDVIFDNTDGSGASFGSDGGDNGYTCFYKCRFIGGTNIHGGSNQPLSKTVAFISCTGTKNIGFSSMHSTARDHVWVVGCSVTSVAVTGPGTKLHISSSNVTGSITSEGGQDTLSDWPKPYGGLSDYDSNYYGIPRKEQ